MEWISVKERMPIDCMIVIIPGGLGYYSWTSFKWYTITHTDIPKPIQLEVEIWMPFPELPKP